MEDQISIVKQGNSPSLSLAVVLYNNRTKNFYRAAQIDTGISETGTFSVTVSDVTGEGVQSLVYTGIAPTGETVFTVLYPSWIRNNSQSDTRGDSLSLKPIANLRAEGTIFIEETYRSDAYSIGLTSGTSFPIWVYTSDPDSPPQSLDQIHTLYQWNKQSGLYEKVSETKVAGKKIEATALARIQDGKVETFVSFLNGLWYKLNPAGEPQYLFFHPEQKELVLLVNNVQEIYDWSSSVLRRNGIYLATSNKSITTLKKRFDITLTALDEIKLKINEDVQMKISADSTWDGDYRKMGKAMIYSGGNRSWEEFTSAIQSGGIWFSPDGTALTFTRDRYSASRNTGEDSGMYSLIQTQDTPAIQFRSLQGNSLFEPTYSISLQKEGDDDTAKEILMLRPVRISAQGIESVIGESFVFERMNSGS
jgi:hypothetical protein